MRKANLFRVSLTALAVAFLLSLAADQRRVVGQEKKADKPAAEKKDDAKPRGRLPAYFSSVVNEKQREAVYGIQEKYQKQLEDLQKQLDALTAQRDKEIDEVLTPEQLTEVNKKREEAAKKREKPAPKVEDKTVPKAEEKPAPKASN